MNPWMKTSFRYFLIFTVSILFLSSCWTLIRPEGFAQHQFMVHNDTELPIWVEFHTENRLLDTTMGQSRLEFVFRDSAMLLEPMDSEEIMLLQFRRFTRERIDSQDFEQRIISLRLVAIDGTDSLPVNMDYRNEDNWLYENSDPISFYTQIWHVYRLSILPSHID